jgi:non-ribosomal peptide synthetase-like protein
VSLDRPRELTVSAPPAVRADNLILGGSSNWDSGIRWRPGERLEQLFEEQSARMRADGRAYKLAVDAIGESLTYPELDARANQLARYLLARGIGPGQRVALLFDAAVHAYVGMLAVLKAGAAYVPLDPGFPADRVAFIVDDAGASAVLSLQHLRRDLGEGNVPFVCVDEVADEIAALDGGSLRADERGEPVDELAYIIYTSGSTGRPKGVAVEHASICNFVRVAAEVYGIRPDDRVYQGLTIAFDFSVEEIWVPWMVGATLVPKPAGSSLLGLDLHEFLTKLRVTAMCCVPTLLATLDDELPDLRFLLVSGEACPHDLIVRWHREGRRFLNVYGPTEATVTATWTVAHPDRAVTIGVPLPTYSVVVLDPNDPLRVLPHGEVGEIGIAGIGLARGYVGREDLTAKAFVPDFLGLPDNPSGRIYRTGDLGRVNADGEIEYLGRIDLQVKIRGYRIELTEIESVLLQVPGIAQAVVDTYEPVPGVVELVGYYTLRRNTSEVDPADIYALLRDRLPPYMVPAYLEQLPAIPMTSSDKADRKRLPPPTGRALQGTDEYTAPATEAERMLAEALAATLGVDRVSTSSHFFDDLGSDSLLLARFCARVRAHTTLPPVSIRDVYLHPTIIGLAAALDIQARPAGSSTGRRTAPVVRASNAQYVLCGAVQLLLFLGTLCATAVVLEGGFRWVSAANGWVEGYARAVVYWAAMFVGYSALPILFKWVLVGRWKPAQFRAWGLRYLRFWLVKTVIRANPMVLFVGSPLYPLYLRALGARIGKGVTILSGGVPVCTDLLTIGAGTVVRDDARLLCYRAEAGTIRTGPVTLGSDVLVGAKTVLDIDTTIEDGGQIGHCSSLHHGQRVPAGQSWHGSPAQPTDTDYRVVEPRRCGTLRRLWFTAMQLAILLLVAPLVYAVVVELVTIVPWTADLLGGGHESLSDWTFYVEILAGSVVLFFGGALLALASVLTVPRLFALVVRPDTVHPLYGLQYYLYRRIRRMTNVKFLHDLFGDSSAIVHYLKALGYDLSRVEQSGSNFGTTLAHDSPYLSTVGSGTMVSDALAIMNADFSATSFRIARVAIGERNYLGNNIAFPVDAKVGANCLLATKAMIPIDGPVRHDVGLLGSPSFEIPRSVQRDDELQLTREEVARGLKGKNRHNARTAGLFLLVRWFQFSCLLLTGLIAADLYYALGSWTLAAYSLVMVVMVLGLGILIERGFMRFRDLQPQTCSIYNPYFWWHERLWKLLASPVFAGTPFRPLIWRMLGVKIGRRVLDLGVQIPEKTLATIGDDATLNEGSVVQCHSLEDGVFKSDRSMIGAGCTLGVESFVHYGVTMGAGSVLDADAFLMKGEVVAAGARWRGNPATGTAHPEFIGSHEAAAAKRSAVTDAI